ncbi:MAG TPA: acetyl-coenzyme A synthetase N-terminal domain-containing protein, partial [Lacibacter sp.]|nr:acetyl-coenzyme A synthetase N-terminal domain-containing protein [Lacibacter sp.]
MSYPYQIRSLEQYKEAYRRSVEEPEAFWAEVAEHFHWRKKWDNVLDWNFKEPRVRWFEGAKLNITENCIDRHLEALGDKPAIIWEPNDPADRVALGTLAELFP